MLPSGTFPAPSAKLGVFPSSKIASSFLDEPPNPKGLNEPPLGEAVFELPSNDDCEPPFWIFTFWGLLIASAESESV